MKKFQYLIATFVGLAMASSTAFAHDNAEVLGATHALLHGEGVIILMVGLTIAMLFVAMRIVAPRGRRR